MRKKSMILDMAVLVTACVLAGCGDSGEIPMKESGETVYAEESSDAIATPESSEVRESEEIQATEEVQESEDSQETVDSESQFSFGDIAGYNFSFLSGAGAWSTELAINEDGTFVGGYHDSDMGDAGKNYPNGTFYWCNFKGKFTKPERVNEYTYSVKLEELKQETEVGVEEIKDGVRYIASGPYGLEKGEEVLIYLPGAPVEELPQEYMMWVRWSLEAEEAVLPFYGLYNVNTQEGFAGSHIPVYAIDNEVAELAEKAAELEAKLLNDELTQTEMNEISMEIYKLWDDELNSIWKRLKKNMNAKEWKLLLEEQRDWIQLKEADIEKLAEEYQGGSVLSLATNQRAAEWTRERVYVLAKYLYPFE